MIRLRHKIAVEQKLAALKLQFFTNVSHELRTPLTLILSPIEQLYKKEKLSSDGIFYGSCTQERRSHATIYQSVIGSGKVENNKQRYLSQRLNL